MLTEVAKTGDLESGTPESETQPCALGGVPLDTSLCESQFTVSTTEENNIDLRRLLVETKRANAVFCSIPTLVGCYWVGHR